MHLFELFGEGLAWSKGHEGRGVIERWRLVESLQQRLLPPFPATTTTTTTW